MPKILRILALPAAIAALVGAAGLMSPGLTSTLIVALPAFTAMLLIAKRHETALAKG
jgi:hypothetical protein